MNLRRFDCQEAEAIRREVANVWRVDMDLHTTRRRDNDTAQARMTYIYLLRKYIGGSYVELAHHCRRDHSTMINAINVVERDVLFNKPFARRLEKLEQFSEAIVSGFYSAAGMMTVAFGKKTGNEVEGWL
jgi:chromosomal replication initiation ATPase DnaA